MKHKIGDGAWRLWSEVLQLALADIRKANLRDDAMRWIMADDQEIGSSVWVCRELSLGLVDVRRRAAKIYTEYEQNRTNRLHCKSNDDGDCQKLRTRCINCEGWRRWMPRENTARIQPVKNLPPRCAVHGCIHRTWSQYEIDVDGKMHAVCDRHKRQHQRWVKLGRNNDMPHLVDRDGHLELTMRTRWGSKTDR